MWLNFYGKERDPFRSSADFRTPFSVQVQGGRPLTRATDEFQQQQSTLVQSLKQIVQGVQNTQFSTFSSDLHYIDEEGDRILLDNDYCYQEAAKYGVLFGELKIVVDGNRIDSEISCKVAMDKAVMATATTRSVETESNISVSVSELDSTSKEPPEWLEGMMEKMRSDLKQDFVEAIRQQPQPCARSKSRTIRQNEPVARATNKSTSSTGNNSPPTSSSVRRFGGGRLVVQQMPSDCDTCCQPINSVRYVCLDKCGVVLCVKCLEEFGHDDAHVLLRLTPNYSGRSKRIAQQAELVMTAMRSVPSANHSSSSSNKSESTNHQKPSSPPVEVDTKVATTDNSNLAPSSSSVGFAAEILRESDAGLMNDLGGDMGAYWKQWVLQNSGTVEWDANVRLFWIENTETGTVDNKQLTPFEKSATVPQLKPGQTGELMVWMYGPVKAPGLYSSVWRLQNTETGTEFGPSLHFNFKIAPAQEERNGVAKGSDVFTAHELDDISVIGTVEDPDFELVSETQSNSSSGRASPQFDHINIDEQEVLESEQNEADKLPQEAEHSTDDVTIEEKPVTPDDVFVEACETLIDLGASVEQSKSADGVDETWKETPLLDQSIVEEEQMMPTAHEDQLGTEMTREHSDDGGPQTPQHESSTRIADDKTAEKEAKGGVTAVYSLKVAVKSAAEKVVKLADNIHAHGRDTTTPSNNDGRPSDNTGKWRPPNRGWTPRASQTEVDFSAFDDWTPPHPWQPQPIPASRRSRPVTNENVSFPPSQQSQSATGEEHGRSVEAVAASPSAEDEQMSMLVSMGFTDIELNKRAIRQHNGDLAEVVDFLLHNFVLLD